MIAVSVQNGLSGEARTHGLVIPNHALYHLSYTQKCVMRESVKAAPPRAGFSRGAWSRGESNPCPKFLHEQDLLTQ